MAEPQTSRPAPAPIPPVPVASVKTSYATASQGQQTVVRVKPGYKTTELWLTILADVAATVLFILHRITQAEWTTITGGTVGLYALVRSITKTNA